MRCGAIVLAAGQGKRMGSEIPKQFLLLREKPVVVYALECFEAAPFLSQIVLVTGEEMIPYCRTELVERYRLRKVTQIVAGGKERYDSVYEGLKALEGTGVDYVFIHDGARPFISQKILERNLAAVQQYGACVTAVPSKDTMKLGTAEGLVERTLDRRVLWNVQTPQTFSFPMILEAHREIRRRNMTGITDDAMIVELLGKCPVKLVEGAYENLKLTTPEDLSVAEQILDRRENDAGCTRRLILASGSPRRRELLTLAGIPFEVVVSDAEEVITKKDPAEIVEELSFCKAKAVADRPELAGRLVLGADTIVALEGQILGKPRDEEDAKAMLRALSGRTHQVYTGVTMLCGERRKTFHVKSDVEVYPLSEKEIAEYVQTGEPMDKAGAYGIQGRFGIHIRGIRGDYYNIVGLPIAQVYRCWKEFLQLIPAAHRE